ncbi:MAG: choice-of-anchor J domain-containing protein [Flavobacteriales bacterium]
MKKSILFTLALVPMIVFCQISTFPWMADFDEVVSETDEVNVSDGWQSLNLNDDNAYWDALANSELSDNNARSAPNSMHMSFHPSNDADDWLITPEFLFEATAVYQLSFYYRNLDAGFGSTENLSVFLLSGSDPIEISMPLVDLPGIEAGDWVLQTVEFTAPATTTYEIGFLCYSDPFQFLLAIDDVEVSLIAASVNELSISELKIQPNPSTGKITLPQLSPNALVEVRNMQGQLVYSEKMTSRTLNLEFLPAGSYLVKSVSKNQVFLSRCLIVN